MTVSADAIAGHLLPGVPTALVHAAYAAAPGIEIASGKFASAESSSALAANAFGFFLERPADLPILPGIAAEMGPPTRVSLEGILRFPWAGGRHPCLDVVVETETALIGIESKRYEPFRPKKPPVLSEAYKRDVWGDRMPGYQRVRNGLRDGSIRFDRLDAAQLVKHALGLRTTSRRLGKPTDARLLYVYAEPQRWPDGRAVSRANIERHRAEIASFSEMVAGDEVRFVASSYGDVMQSWLRSEVGNVREHARRLVERFDLISAGE